ncbi:hypothetical protein [Flavobacterium sp.]|uniref:hypothetical protein n=4 Tax=Flavobacterium sp. TaxID=239 RepID=UPI0040488272
MKLSNKIFTFFVILISISSCTNEVSDLSTKNNIESFEYKKAVFESKEFKNILIINNGILKSLESKLKANRTLNSEIINNNYDANIITKKLKVENEMDDYIQSLNKEIVLLLNKFPELKNNEINYEEYYLDLISTFNVNNNNKLQLRINPCQTQFDKDIAYIHGQYDARVFGAAISFVATGGASAGLSMLTLGYAVVSAVWDVANAIDDYNACMGK